LLYQIPVEEMIDLKLIVLSDTHAGSIAEIPKAIVDRMAEADLIVHAGDFTDIAVLEGLESMGKVKAVHGNMCSHLLKKRLPPKQVFKAGGKRIGLTHGSGGRSDLVPRIRQMFDNVDIIIFGHSHEPYKKVIGGTLMFNPGSARYSFGILTIEDSVKAEIIRL